MKLSILKASDGWLYYFKKQHNFVDRHIDKVIADRPTSEQEGKDDKIKKFRDENIPLIVTYPKKKVYKPIFCSINIYS